MRLACAVAVLLAGLAARAEDPRETARRHFDAGKLAFDAGRFEEALAEFDEAYALAPYPQLLYNRARCHAQLGHARRALDDYERYLAVNPGDTEARARAEELRAAAAAEPPLPPPTVARPPPGAHPPAPAPLVAVAPPPRAPPRPLYKRWWLWTAVTGTVVAAVGIGLGVGLTRPAAPPSFPPLTGQ